MVEHKGSTRKSTLGKTRKSKFLAQKKVSLSEVSQVAQPCAPLSARRGWHQIIRQAVFLQLENMKALFLSCEDIAKIMEVDPLVVRQIAATIIDLESYNLYLPKRGYALPLFPVESLLRLAFNMHATEGSEFRKFVSERVERLIYDGFAVFGNWSCATEVRYKCLAHVLGEPLEVFKERRGGLEEVLTRAEVRRWRQLDLAVSLVAIIRGCTELEALAIICPSAGDAACQDSPPPAEA